MVVIIFKIKNEAVIVQHFSRKLEHTHSEYFMMKNGLRRVNGRRVEWAQLPTLIHEYVIRY